MAASEPDRFQASRLALAFVVLVTAGGGGCAALAGVDEFAVGRGAESDGGGGDDTPCERATCADLGATCGEAPDGCGGVLSCGTCPEGLACTDALTCACSPVTCADLGKDCGTIADGCGGTVYCGNCPKGLSCGGGGENVCGTGECTPKDCADRGAQCGTVSNGCDGVVECPACPNGLACEGNRCTCPPTWTRLLSAQSLLGRLVPSSGGHFYALGSNLSLSQAYAGRFDACGGAPVAESSFVPAPGGSAEVADGLVLQGDLFVAGTTTVPGDPGQGFFARLDPASLVPEWIQVVGGPGDDSLRAIAVSADDRLWMTGEADTEEGPRHWVVKAATSGDACEHATGVAGHGTGVASHPAANEVIVAGGSPGPIGLLTRFPLGACGQPLGACTTCEPAAQIAYLDAAGAFEPFQIEVVGSTAWAIATICSDTEQGDCHGIVASIDLAAAEPIAVLTYDPTPDVDGFLDLRARGGQIYVTGTRGLSAGDLLNGKWSSGEGVVLEIDPASPAAPAWATTVAAFDVGTSILPLADGGLIVAGLTDAGSVLHRCDAATECQ